MFERRALTYSVVGVFSSIGITCVVLLIAKLPYWDVKAPEWIGALGTIAAFAGTIFIATAETRRRNREEMTRAKLQASALTFRVKHVVLVAKELNSKIEEFYDEADAEKCLAFCTYVKKKITALQLWTVDEVAILAPLPNNTAERLAQVMDEVYRLATLMDAAQLNELKTMESRRVTKNTLHQTFHRMNKLLGHAVQECHDARFINY
ncbi:hypothetical protein IFU01_12335 [Oxalobacteraceae sp. CFBP 8763]|nr:hypothetical protein [Oxalobacteraceae sp. CFBP 8763]